MRIEKTARFLLELEQVLEFIAEDSFLQAQSFKNDLDKSVYSLLSMPYKCRQSIKSKHVNVRDLIFMGYVVPYRVNDVEDRIEIIGIFNGNQWNI